jgi:hypothetical protein
MPISQNTKRQIIAIGITCVIAWFFAFLAIHVFVSYAFGLFIWLPIVIGALSTILYVYKNETNKYSSRNVAFLTLFIFCLGLLTFAFEGLICIIMAAPIGLLFTWIGYLIGYAIIKNKTINPSIVSVFLIISVPILMGFDYIHKDANGDLRSVSTSIIIKAPKETVWKSVTEFSQIKEPTDLLFKSGIAYPINAKIDGKGVGAIRHCNFSTGSFVEPITEWDEPNILRFNVSQQPETMKELSFYDLHPNHLHGYFISKHGQFKLTSLADGSTLLEGTTWYYNKIKPGLYWNLWSDYIIHKIHERVLNHIKNEAEVQNK